MIEHLNSIHLALFVRAPPPSALDLWKMSVVVDPGGFQTIGPGHTMAQGEHKGLSLQIASQSGRVDVMLMPQTDPQQTEPVMPSIPSLDEAVSAGVAIGRTIIPLLLVGRVAAVAQGVTSASDGANAVAIIKQLVSDLKTPEGATRVNYEVVVPRSAIHSATGRTLDICRWQAAQQQVIEMRPGQGFPLVKTRDVVHFYGDAGGEVMQAFQADQAVAALEEVAERVKVLFRDGYDALV